MPRGSGDLSAFLADGSAPSARRAGGPEATPSRITPAHAAALASGVSSVIVQAPAHRSPALWLVGTAVAGMIAVAVSFGDQMVVSTEDRAAASALTADAERVASVFDASARAAHMRADGIATTPMLRAAIETDAATLSDLASSEMVFTAGKGEELEVFQFAGSKAKSLLRIPRSGTGLQPLKGRETRVRSDGKTITLVASAPISGYRAGVGGGVVLSVPVDVASIQHALADHTSSALITGLGSDLVLLAPGGPSAGAPVKLAVPSSGDWNAGGAMLVATPRRATGLAWAGKVRIASVGLSGLLLIGFVVSLVRRRHSSVTLVPGDVLPPVTGR
jgi:hypothetical protein